jgi:hypothetical protein
LHYRRFEIRGARKKEARGFCLRASFCGLDVYYAAVLALPPSAAARPAIALKTFVGIISVEQLPFDNIAPDDSHRTIFIKKFSTIIVRR